MLLTALTGNYGTGKSTVLSMFGMLGACTLDSDRIVASLLTGPDVLIKIRALLGDKVFDENGNVDKKMLGDIIFQDADMRTALENIIHPLVFARIREAVYSAQNAYPVLIVEVPVLFERGYENRFHRSITVYAGKETSLCRLEAEGVTRDNAIARLRTQMPSDEKKKRSDFIIDNNGTREATMSQVAAVYNKLVKEADEWKLSKGLNH
jgi:dephospho-CoA kinase